jgi:predicted lipoprotein with Yx(FWY)xxD motif
MSAPNRWPTRLRAWTAATLLVAVAALAAAGVATLAVAKSFTLKVRNNVHDINAAAAKFAVKNVNTHEAVAVGPSGYPVYTFQGETTHDLICKKTTNPKTNCWVFWPPVSVTSSKGNGKQSGIQGTLGTFRNHGALQLTLNAQPLYYFTPDIRGGNKHVANGDWLKTFGSIWHLVRAKSLSSGPSPGSIQTSSTSSSTTPTSTSSTTSSTTSTTSTAPSGCIPQGGGGDGDSDNQGAPSDGDGCM